MVPVSIYQTVTASGAVNVVQPGVAVSSTNTYYSQPWSSRFGHNMSIGLFWTGTPTGTFTLWFSDTPTPDLTNDNDWHQDTAYVPGNPAGAAGKTGDNWAVGAARWWRIKYVNASGSGVLTGYVHVASA